MENSQSDSDQFSVRIVSIDYYMSPPITDIDICYSSFQGKVNEVPVIRIYGSTPASQKTCLHVHKVMPYLYVPCLDLLQTSEEGHRYTREMCNSIEKALQSKIKSSSGAKRQHVHGCSLVRARKFYGFHASEDLFVKVYLYYPHEVARVATLLLDGTVLNRSYQPHESHIPYLLQFLVDYNLYGMGHLHVSKVKFRYPLPDGFVPRVVRQSGVLGDTTNKGVCTSANDQADSCTNPRTGQLVWTSSTVPTGWMWPPPNATCSSPDLRACLVKRQSTCELEGDATVDEIVNQQFKMYTSLSQTRSEVKMVQSLVPIWQEEYERTGLHEEVIHNEPIKPLPEDVMRTLSHGPECENALMDLCREAESSSSLGTPIEEAEKFMQSISSLAEVGSLCEMGEHVIQNCSSQCSEERNSSGSASLEGSLLKQDDDAIPSGSSHRSPEIVLASEEMASLKAIDKPDSKGKDIEALGLLKWLASSQGEEDLNTDDELGYDLVLTPLLPKTSIHKILEKANMDYECESQQECQDILDSVLDAKCNVSKERASQSSSDNSSSQIPPDNILPQVDGSCDDLPTHGVDDASEIDVKSEIERSLHRIRPSNENKKSGRLWGRLPFSTRQKVNEDLDTSSFNSDDVSNEMKTCTSSSSSSGKNDNEGCDYSVTDTEINNHGLNEQKELTGSSLRELMRRKRRSQTERSEVGASRVKKIQTRKQQKSSISPKRLEFHVKSNDMECLVPDGILGKPLVTDNPTTTSERSSNRVTHMQRSCPKVGEFGHAYGDISMYGKLPLMSGSDRSLQRNMPKNDNSVSHKRPNHIEPFGDFSRKQSTDAEVSLAFSERKEVPISPISMKYGTVTGTGEVRCSEAENSEFLSRCSMAFDEKEEGHTGSRWLPGTFSATLGNTDAAISADAPTNENLAIQQNIQTCSLCPSVPETITSEGVHAKYIEMSSSKNPPIIDWNNGTSRNTSYAPVVHDTTSIANLENTERSMDCDSDSSQFERSAADEIPPFFSDDVQGVDKSYRNSEVNNSGQEAVFGIPIHFQNDGSLSYLLTTMYSPPSVGCVREWLFHHPPRHNATGSLVESIKSEVAGSASQNRSCNVEFLEKSAMSDAKTPPEPPMLQTVLTCENDMNFRESLANVRHEALPKSFPVPCLEPSMAQLAQKNGNLKTKSNYPEIVTKLHRDGTVLIGNVGVEQWRDVSQVSGPEVRSKLTPLSQTGFRDPASVGEGQQLTIMSIEVQAESRGDLRPNPRFDAITVIAFAIQDDNDHNLEAFVLLRGNDAELNQRNVDGISGCTVIVALEEKQLLHHFVKIVRSSDPDILMGWEIQGGSLGFLAERAAHLGIVLLNNISRTPSCEPKVPARDSPSQELQALDDVLPIASDADPAVIEDAIIEDEWGRTHASGVHVGGRIVLNLWRLMRGEIKLNMYTIEAVAEEVLRRKVPLIPPRILTQWFLSGPGRARFRCIEYIMERVKLNLEIMTQLDMVNRTSELARVFGIDFFSVLSRGSQYRVESMFLRLAHTQNYLAVSPGNQQVASQPAMECLPLVMEPESRFYADPVVVLDFQSLYPSMIIAYNLCYCTCLGKVIPAKENTLGVSSFLRDPQLLMDLKKKILLTPNGVMYVPSEVRKGVLPRLLEEILSTRIMVKRAMKQLTPSQRVLHRIFNARQLALKLISNVTYGYTAAGFSGRMPCAELADSIVQCGRRTLENAISFVNSHDKWNARVIYGDTDSMFVLLKGRTVKESFTIGQEIASVITSMNPHPVTLKMEKVYHPCFLLTKKRYVGYSYETPDQASPLFDAKGIETVRRDSCGAVAKTLEQSLRIFFEQQDISKVKVYLQRQWTRILTGRVSLPDFIFAKEVRLGTYSTRTSSLPPAAIVATKAMKADPRAEPHYGERIPYVVIHGEPGARLVDMVVDPLELLAIESPFRLNDLYYIDKQIIPALQRVFGLVGADLRLWFMEMPKPIRASVGKRVAYAPNGQKTRIDSYYVSSHCVVCGELSQASVHLCEKCLKKEAVVATVVSGRSSKLEKEIHHLAAICRHCGGGDWIVESGVKCESLACKVFYERRKVQKELQAVSSVATEMGFYPRCVVEWF